MLLECSCRAAAACRLTKRAWDGRDDAQEPAAQARRELLGSHSPLPAGDGIQYLGKLAAMTALNLRGLRHACDSALSCAARMPALRDLVVDCCPEVGGGALMHVAALRALRKLVLRFCPKVDDRSLQYLSAVTSLEVRACGHCRMHAEPQQHACAAARPPRERSPRNEQGQQPPRCRC